MNGLRHLLRRLECLPLSCQCSGANGMIDFPQESTSPLSWSSMMEVGGRLGGSMPRSTTHVVNNNSHSVSENPKGGLYG